MRASIRLFVLPSVLLAAACAGVTPRAEPARVRWADDVGSVTVSPVSVTRWEDVAAKLQPKFKMDSDIALARAIPTTQSLDERFSDILQASLRAALPTTVVNDVATTTTNDAGELKTTVNKTVTKASGDAKSVDPAALPAATAATLAGLGSVNMNQDPMLQYLAATAIQQEVELLNRYVTDAIKVPGAQAFLVRMQLSVMPNRRGMPYDVLTDITLHAADASEGNEQHRAGLAPPPVPSFPGKCDAGSYDTLRVLPMVVTDNLEGLAVSQSSDTVRQIGLALMATAGNVGLGGNFARTMEALRNVQGRDTNSLLTVGKLSDDTIRVRLGAAQNPRLDYVTIPRTHNISLLVIYRPCTNAGAPVTDKVREISAMTRTVYRDALTGQALPYQSATARLGGLMKELRDKYPADLTFLEFTRLFQWAMQQDRTRFFGYFNELARSGRSNFCTHGMLERVFDAKGQLYEVPPEHYEKLRTGTADANVVTGWDPRCVELNRQRYRLVAASLWTDLQSVRPAGEYSFTGIPIALRTPRPQLPPMQIALLNQSQAEATVTLPQGRDLAGSMRYVMHIERGADPTPIYASEVSVSPDATALSGKFPPLAKFGVKDGDPLQLVVEATTSAPTNPLCGSTPLMSPEAACSQRYALKLADSTPAKSSAVTIASTASGIIADASGKGRLGIIVKAEPNSEFPAKLFLSIDGAELREMATVRGAALSSEASGWRVTGPGETALFFENLIPNQVVTVSLLNEGKDVSNIKRTVLQGASARAKE